MINNIHIVKPNTVFVVVDCKVFRNKNGLTVGFKVYDLKNHLGNV